MDPNTAMETLGEGAKAVSKLGGIIEKLFGPRWTRKQADADAYADQKKLQTIRDNPDMQIFYADGKINARQYTEEEILFRAEQRRIADSIRQEKNLEKVLENTSNELQSVENVSDEDVDDDWISRFFSIVKDISNEEMQFIWGKILAGEITAPKSFSLRTLETLRNMSTEDAQTFQRIIPLVLHNENNYFVLSDSDILNKYGSSFSDILTLDDCGLMDSSGTLSLNLSVKKDNPECILSDTFLILIKGKKDESERIRIGIHTLTRAGLELFNILVHEPKPAYMTQVAEHIFSQNAAKTITSVHKINSLEKDGAIEKIVYDPVPLASYSEDTNL